MVRSKILSRLVILFTLCLVLSLLVPQFLRAENLLNVIRQAAILNILGIGMTMVILTGGIDLSNGAVLALSSCVAAIYLKEGGPILVGILISLGIGLACGLVNGWMVARVLIPPFVITYAMMFFARGLAYIVLKGKIIYGFSKTFRFLGAGHLFTIPTPIILSAFILSLFYFLLRYTPFGADLYAVGSDEESSRLSGIRTQNRVIWVYALSGLLSASAGIIYTSRLNAAEPVIGEFFPLDAIAAVVLGGTLLEGGGRERDGNDDRGPHHHRDHQWNESPGHPVFAPILCPGMCDSSHDCLPIPWGKPEGDPFLVQISKSSGHLKGGVRG